MTDKYLKVFSILGLSACAALTTACTHKVQLVAPDKPIEINLNVKIDQEVRIRLDEDIDNLIEENADIF